MPSFTPEDLLLYLYNETSPEMTKAVEEALKNDWTLREKLNVLKISKQRLNNVIESPRTEVILKILNYAREKTEANVKM